MPTPSILLHVYKIFQSQQINPGLGERRVKIVTIKWNLISIKVSKGAKIRNRYNQVPHLTQDTNGKVTNSQLDTTNESQEVSPFPAADHKAQINRHAQRHNKHKTEKNKNDLQTKYRIGAIGKTILLEGLNNFHSVNLALNSDADQDIWESNKTQQTRQPGGQSFPSW